MGEIILYSSPGCVHCSLVKQMLDKHNVKYEVSEDRQLMISKDLSEMPTIEVNGELIEGYSRVLTWLDENNYYSL